MISVEHPRFSFFKKLRTFKIADYFIQQHFCTFRLSVLTVVCINQNSLSPWHTPRDSYTFSYIYQKQNFYSFKHCRYTSSDFFAQLFFQSSFLAIHSYAFPNHAAVMVIYHFRKPKAKNIQKAILKI